jgi:hypothetical protein
MLILEGCGDVAIGAETLGGRSVESGGRVTRWLAVGGHGLCGAHNSAVIAGHDNAIESPTATVAKRNSCE